MGLLNPGALIFFMIVPALIVAYLARERPARVTVSSVLAFRALRGFRKQRFGGVAIVDAAGRGHHAFAVFARLADLEDRRRHRLELHSYSLAVETLWATAFCRASTSASIHDW